MERFAGKKVIECQVSDGINKAEELIKRAMEVMHLYMKLIVQMEVDTSSLCQ